MDTLLQDARFAMRRLAGQRRITLAALVTLALGIGANTAMFSIVYGLLLRPLPYPDARGIVHVGESIRGPEARNLSNRSMVLLQDAESFEQLAAYGERSVEWTSPDGVVVLRGSSVSPSLFPLLRAAVHLGRFFTEEEAREGANRVVLLSHRAWTSRFASDRDILGTAVYLDGNPHTVVGVLAEGFYFPNPAGEFWTPFVVPPLTSPVPVEAGESRLLFLTTFSALGRLAPGVSPERAATEVRTLLQNNPLAFPGPPSQGGRPQVAVRVVPLLEEMVGEYRPALRALTVATILVLLMACASLAGLLLARGMTGKRVLAVCAALGASRGRLVRQLLLESVMLSGGGGVLGVGLAALVLRVVPSIVPGDIARLHEVGIDGVALVFTFGLAIATGLLFGAVPALQWSRSELASTLNEGSVQSAGSFRLIPPSRARAALAIAQVAFALVLLVGASVLLRNFVRLITVDRGYDPANVVTARIRNRDLAVRLGMTTEFVADLRAVHRRFQESLLAEAVRLENLSEVAAVGISTRLPLAPGGTAITEFRVLGSPPPADPRDRLRGSVNFVSARYFDVMHLRLRDGRVFTRVDGAESPRVLVVNETLARELFGGSPAVGQRLLLAGGSREPWEVIGIVEDVRYDGVMITESSGEALVSLHQAEQLPGLFVGTSVLSVRTAGDPRVVVPFLREAVTAASPRASIEDVMTMDDRLSISVAQPRLYSVLVGFFAALALFLAAFGIYALLSYTVSQRRCEIGIRMALGAQRRDILALVVRQGAALVGAGTLLGLLVSAASVSVLESLLFGVAIDDRLTFVAAPVVLALVALVACWLPGLRATRINPMDALRVE